ncbi:MAG: hypothetical protein ACXWW4_03865 [Candidatus Binatia bacterium]|nr:hypothetical protein [Candidatus Deferrimicrobium sp.]
MFEIETLMQLGVFNQLIPIWQVFFFIAALLPFLLMDRVKMCLLVTYLFTFYLGFMVQWGEYLSSTGSMQPFVLYSLSGLAIAVFFVATIFTDPAPSAKVRWVRYGQADRNTAEGPVPKAPHDPMEIAVDVTHVSEYERH